MMNERLGIGIIHPSLAYQGGAELTIVWLVDGLIRRGHRVTIVTGALSASIASQLSPQAEVVVVDRTVAAGDWLDIPREVVSLVQKLDVLTVHNYPSYLWLGTCREELPPILFFCQEPPQALHARVTQRHFLFQSLPGLLRNPLTAASVLRLLAMVAVNRLKGWAAIERRAVARCDYIAANSGFTADNIARLYERKAVVCLLGIPDIGEIADAGSSGSPPPRQIIIPGRWSAIKNLENALRAFTIVVDSHPGLLRPRSITVPGEGRQRQLLARLIKRRGLEEIIDLHEQVPHARMGAFYQDHECVMAIPFDEPFGLVAVEAMSAGRPVIGSRQGGLLETVLDGETGVLVDPDDPAAIARAVVDLLTAPDRCREMGRAGRARFTAMFTLDHFVDRFLAICRSLLKAKKPRSGGEELAQPRNAEAERHE